VKPSAPMRLTRSYGAVETANLSSSLKRGAIPMARLYQKVTAGTRVKSTLASSSRSGELEAFDGPIAANPISLGEVRFCSEFRSASA
jgi:hypothetical protein